MTRVTLLSGGKDSLYAAMQLWPVDYGVLLYEFPRPSPHLLNLGKTVETLTLAGIPSWLVYAGAVSGRRLWSYSGVSAQTRSWPGMSMWRTISATWSLLPPRPGPGSVSPLGHGPR